MDFYINGTNVTIGDGAKSLPAEKGGRRKDVGRSSMAFSTSNGYTPVQKFARPLYISPGNRISGRDATGVSYGYSVALVHNQNAGVITGYQKLPDGASLFQIGDHHTIYTRRPSGDFTITPRF